MAECSYSRKAEPDPKQSVKPNYRLTETNGKRPVDFSEPTGILGYNRTVNLVLPLFRI